MGRKSTAEVAARQKDCRDMLLEGKSTSHILSWMNTNYGVARSTVERDITTIYGQLRKYMEKNVEDIIGEHVAKYDHIYEICMEVPDIKNAMQALKQKESLLQMHTQQPLINVTQQTLNLNHVGSVEELKQLLINAQ